MRMRLPVIVPFFRRRALTTGILAAGAATAAFQDQLRAADFTWNNGAGDELARPAMIMATTAMFELSGGNDLSLTAIPEPGVLLTLAGGIGTLLGLQRFRRRPPARRREVS